MKGGLVSQAPPILLTFLMCLSNLQRLHQLHHLDHPLNLLFLTTHQSDLH